jgi:hypothetical protein
VTSTNTKALEGQVVPVNGDPLALDPGTVEAYASILASVPDAGRDGFEGMLRQLLEAQDATDLDAPWRSEGLEAFRNTPLVITGIRKMPSEYEGGLPWFLVIDAAVVGTGERVTISTGAVSVVAQLARAWALGALPLKVIPRQSDRPSKAGYYPQHLEVMR